MKNIYTNFYILAFLVGSFLKQSYAFEGICNRLSVSSNVTETRSDVIKNGKVQRDWQENSNNPVFTQSTLEIDYFYLTVTGIHTKLSNKDIKLSISDYNFCDSKAEILTHKNLGKGVLVVYSGSQIQISSFPIVVKILCIWKKVSGNPLSLEMDLQWIQKLIENIIKPLLEMDFWQMPPILIMIWTTLYFEYQKIRKQSIFYLYMDVDQDSAQQNLKETDDVFELLADVMMLVPEEKVDPLFIDANEQIMNPIIKGKVVNGGMINQGKSKVIIDYQCKRHGDSVIQLNIPLTYFKDINLFFIKECSHQIGNEAWEMEQRIGIFPLVMLLLFIAFIAGTFYNVYYLNKTGADSIPFLVVTIEFLNDFTVTRNFIKKTREVFNDQIGKLKKQDYDVIEGNSEDTESRNEVTQQEDQETQSKKDVPLQEYTRKSEQQSEGNYGSL